MLAYINEEAWNETLKTGNATYKLNGVGVIDAESLKADNVRSDRAGIGSIRY